MDGFYGIDTDRSIDYERSTRKSYLLMWQGLQEPTRFANSLSLIANVPGQYPSQDSTHSIEELSFTGQPRCLPGPRGRGRRPPPRSTKISKRSQPGSRWETVLDRSCQDLTTSQRKPRIKWPSTRQEIMETS